MTKPRRNCSVCPTGRTSGRLCAACVAAKKDKESAWDLKQNGGYWRHVRGGVREWVPLLLETEGPEPEPEEGEAHEPDLRTCGYDGCGGWFLSDNPRQVYCGRPCLNAADRQRRKAREQVAA